MKLWIQTLTGQREEVEADPKNTILDLKVSLSFKGLDTPDRLAVDPVSILGADPNFDGTNTP